jgi:hypothetical protein
MITEIPKEKTYQPPIGNSIDQKEESPNPARKIRDDLLSALEVGPAGKIGEMDLDSKGYRDDRTEKKYDGSPAWFEDHMAKTPTGSLVAGTLHNANIKTAEDIRKQILPGIIKSAEELLLSGRRVIFIAEGAPHGIPGSEQEMVAEELDNLSGGKIGHDTWDDQSVEIFGFDEGENQGVDFNLPLVKKLVNKFRDAKIVEASLYAMMYGQGYKFPITAGARQFLEKIGVDPADQSTLYKITFPSNGDKDTILAKVCREYNRLRQENMLRKIKGVEMAGAIAIVTPGASHVYSLKNILEQGLY